MASIAAVSRSNASAESVVEFDLEEKVEVSIGLTTSVVENQNIILPEKECYDLTETITNKNKRIEELEQEINDIKLRLENAQRQITNLTKKQFVLENLKAKKNTAAFYTGFLITGMLLRRCTIILIPENEEETLLTGVLEMVRSLLIMTRISQRTLSRKKEELGL